MGHVELRIYERSATPVSSKVAYKKLDVSIKPCTKEELGLDAEGEAVKDGGTQFYPFNSISTQKLVKRFYKNLRCIDSD